MPLSLERDLLHKASLPRPGVIADLPNTQKHKETVKMGRQRNRPQWKEQENSPEEKPSEMEASDLSDIKLKVMTIRCSTA